MPDMGAIPFATEPAVIPTLQNRHDALRLGSPHIQVSVGEFEPTERLTEPLERIGYAWRPGNPELAKRRIRHAGSPTRATYLPRSKDWVLPTRMIVE